MLDWNEPVGAPRALIVASDIVYERNAPAVLFSLVDTAGMLAPGGTMIIAGPRVRTLLLDVFVSLLVLEGYGHRQEATSVDWDDHRGDIDIHVLRRPS